MPGAPRVLVTRPEPGASETARRLEALGFLPIKLPLQAIKPLPVGAGAIPGDVAAVAVTSVNAIRHAHPELLQRLIGLPCFAVGASTAVAAAKAGFSNVIEGGGDGDALADTIVGRHSGGALAYLCGKVRRPTFEERLADEHIPIHVVETYDTIDLDYSIEEVINLATRCPIDHVLVYSANSAKVLTATMRRPELEDLFEKAIFACISGRVAEALGGGLDGRVWIAAEPDERALLSLLERARGAAS